ncbi:hypothetical protein HRR83_004073 [Exophiala dermatitidis]|nr:hypothetical protein HRR73_007716 [Exophiala dermatitidis]KAJ4517934.1 hypothetical protein HRR75_003155 [Exophiala dermatitidis]KAJ4531800.1 hypothetical protein HRR77_009209 [Exophiala dermatitidis]KAJ4537364.1 hypothetical protein HRR76_005374 [Exophiala dermatitidis]KAJ4552207.1 hypothetical protein HRR78_003776 [Exophiala dermatitidis]
MPPLALTVISWVSISIATLASLWITFDIVYRRGWRSMMAVMIPVYIINALYLWPITVWTYIKYGRPGLPSKKIEDEAAEGEEDPLLQSNHWMYHSEGDTAGERHSGGSQTVTNPRSGHHGHSMGHRGGAQPHPHDTGADPPMFATITIATCHCGAGCVLGDMIGEWLIYKSDATINGSMLYAAFVVDFVLALAFGIVFQYFSIAPMVGDYGWKSIIRSAKADFLSLVFFEIGLFGWMAIFDLLIFDQKLGMNNMTYWFMMQIGMFFGHWTGFPINWVLINRGIKEACA